MIDENAVSPDVDDLLQETDDLPAVVVRPAGPVRTYHLPARVAYSRSVNVGNSTDPAQLEIIASEDMRRSYITIICSGQPAYVGHDKQDVASGICGILPVGVPVTLPTSAPVYVRAAAAGVSVVSYWVGNWAD